MPYVNPNGMPYDHVAPSDTFEQAVKILDHEGFRKQQRDALAQGRYLGLGFAAYIEPTGAATGHLGTEGATIRVEPTGKVNVYVNGGSTGNSIETTVVQLTADALGPISMMWPPSRVILRSPPTVPAPRAAAAAR